MTRTRWRLVIVVDASDDLTSDDLAGYITFEVAGLQLFMDAASSAIVDDVEGIEQVIDRTPTGRVLTDADYEAFADEAEQGHPDV